MAALPHGITLSCRRKQSAAPKRVMFLHGFPEAAFVWDEVMQLLQADAQCVAPNLRGFEHSSRPSDAKAYRTKYLVADVLALIEQQGGPLDMLVAHDWGGAVAWSLAAQYPQALKQLVILNSPHPATFLRELRANPAQQAASAYMNFLCRPDAEALLTENTYARLWRFFCHAADGTQEPPAWLDAALRSRYEAMWALGLQGGLNYYVSSPLKPAMSADDLLHTLVLPPETVTVNLPTTVLWGERDAALLPSLLDGLEAWVPNLRIERLPQASHWLVHEQPRQVAAVIRQALITP